MKIAQHDLDERVFLIAEIGNNHEGDVDLASRLIELAADAGADASDNIHVNAYVQQTEARTSPWGDAGGAAGERARVVLEPGRPGELELPCKAIGLKLARGQTVRLQSSGGGGWGPVTQRDPARIEQDRAPETATD